MSSPLLLAPLRAEAAAARYGVRGRGTVRVERTGMGPQRAAAAAERLGRGLAPLVPVAVVGFAGGLAAEDRAGDIVVATELTTSDGSLPARRLDEGLAARLVKALSEVLDRVRSGPVLCTSTVLGTKKASVLAAAGSSRELACEMESAWLAPLGEGRPFAVVRAVVDRPGRPLLGPWTLWAGARAWGRLARAAGVVTDQLEQY